MITDGERARVVNLILEKFTIGAQTRLAEYPALAKNAMIDVAAEMCADDLIVSLRTFVPAASKIVQRVDVPETWWDAVKERWFPDWALDRWPAQYRTLSTVIMYVCPHATIAWPDSQEHLRFLLKGEI